METVIDLKCSLPNNPTSLSPTALIWQDVLAQAITGELLAAMNYTSLSEICDDPEEVAKQERDVVFVRGRLEFEARTFDLVAYKPAEVVAGHTEDHSREQVEAE